MGNGVFFKFNNDSDKSLLGAACLILVLCTGIAISNTPKEQPVSEPETEIKKITPADSLLRDTINYDSIENQQRNQLIAEKDSAIKYLFNEIDSLMQNKTKHAKDSLYKNKKYLAKFIVQNKLDSLEHDNKRQLRRAQRAAKRSPSFVKDIPCDEETFYKFFHVDGVKKAYRTYMRNKRMIEKLEVQKRAIPTDTKLQQKISQYYDSLTIAEVTDRLTMIEILLQRKDSIISEKQR